jgi:hypothetical protein
MSNRLRDYLLMAVLSAISLAAYLIASRLLYRLGFPLDDAWIHQTYARNLASRGEWAFLPGQPSAGSTAPLWSIFLAGGYWLRIEPLVWTYLLGWVLLAAIGWVGMGAFRALSQQKLSTAIWVGVFLVFEWHLVWAAGSGMETLAHSFLALLVLSHILGRRVHWFRLGLLVGMSIWVRPDGVTLIVPAVLAPFFLEPNWKGRAKALARLGLGVTLLVAPYLAFNYILAGAVWPNTFFAKQAEYASHRQFLFWVRLGQQMLMPLVGAGLLVLPGWVYLLVASLRRREWLRLLGIGWVLEYLILYAWRLPVTHQHGRYVIPAMGVYFVWGLAGSAEIWNLVKSASHGKRQALLGNVLTKSWRISLAVVLAAFWLQGMQSYAWDVAVIESEMVTTAKWVAENTEADALIAAHDIGALGYFGERRLLDLAGLVSPEVIPFIRDEIRLQAYLDEQGADYLVTLVRWYPLLEGHSQLIYLTGSRFSPDLGGENMAVYKWLNP